MSFEGAKINKLNGGLGRITTSDRLIVLVAGMVLPEDLAYNTAYELYDITTAEDLGITATSDDTNNELTHHNLSKMFKIAPESTFWIIPVDKTKTVAALVADAALKTAIRGISGVNVIGLLGLNTAVSAALADAVALQSLVTSFATEHILIDGIFVEGVGAAEPITVANYPDLRTITAPNISYMIGQDPAVAALKAAYALRAGIGTVLGSVAVRRVHEDLGSVAVENPPRSRRGEENFSLSDEASGHWLSAALSDGVKVSSLTMAEQKALTAKGYMYVGSFPEYGGFYLNGCPTAVSKASDYAYFNLNCIWNKAARLIRKTLIPKVRSKVPTDTTTGYLKSTWVAGCEADVLRSLDGMLAAGNIEGCDVYINPAQAPTEDTPLEVKGKLVVGKIVHEFSVDLGLTEKL